MRAQGKQCKSAFNQSVNTHNLGTLFSSSPELLSIEIASYVCKMPESHPLKWEATHGCYPHNDPSLEPGRDKNTQNHSPRQHRGNTEISRKQANPTENLETKDSGSISISGHRALCTREVNIYEPRPYVSNVFNVRSHRLKVETLNVLRVATLSFLKVATLSFL